MVQQRRNLFQIDSFEVYGAKVRGYKRYLKLSLQEAKNIIELLLSGLAQGRVDSFTVTAHEEEVNHDKREKTAHIIV